MALVGFGVVTTEVACDKIGTSHNTNNTFSLFNKNIYIHRYSYTYHNSIHSSKYMGRGYRLGQGEYRRGRVSGLQLGRGLWLGLGFEFGFEL